MKEHISTSHLSHDIAKEHIKDSGSICKYCGKDLYVKINLVRHIGSTHGKVVEIMERKGFHIPNILVLGVKRKLRNQQQEATGSGQPALKVRRSQRPRRGPKAQSSQVPWLEEEPEIIIHRVGAGDRVARRAVLRNRSSWKKIARRPFIHLLMGVEVEDLGQ